MSEFDRRIFVVTIISFVLGLAATLMSITAYSVAKSIQVAPSVAATQISIGQKFNWTVAEVVDIQGNLYAYLGYEYGISGYPNLLIAKWQNGWMQLSYGGLIKEAWMNVTLSPYKLYIQGFDYNYLTATFFES